MNNRPVIKNRLTKAREAAREKNNSGDVKSPDSDTAVSQRRRNRVKRNLSKSQDYASRESIVEPSYEEVFPEEQRNSYEKYVQADMGPSSKNKFSEHFRLIHDIGNVLKLLPSAKPPVVDLLVDQGKDYRAIPTEVIRKYHNEFVSNRLKEDDRRVLLNGEFYTINSRFFKANMDEALEYSRQNNPTQRQIMKNYAANELVARGINVDSPEDIIIGVPLVINGVKVKLPVYEDHVGLEKSAQENVKNHDSSIEL